METFFSNAPTQLQTASLMQLTGRRQADQKKHKAGDSLSLTRSPPGRAAPHYVWLTVGTDTQEPSPIVFRLLFLFSSLWSAGSPGNLLQHHNVEPIIAYFPAVYKRGQKNPPGRGRGERFR